MTAISESTRKLLTLSMLPGVGPATLRKISTIEAMTHRSVEEIAKHFTAIQRAISSDKCAWSIAVEKVQYQLEMCEQFEARILSPMDADYPYLLAATKDDPFLIYVRGKLNDNNSKSVAIIGTREPTKHGILIAERITGFFVEEGWSIVSGLALGCDAIAHRTAVLSKGHTVAVLAHGLQTTAPSQHKKLAEDILSSGGALISEYPFGQKAFPQQFVKRDRTQAGMAQGVVMIQSDIKGGSLHASRAALDYGRWLAVPYPTEADENAKEPKAQANLLIANGQDFERANLLRCTPKDLGKIIILRNKNDYTVMTNTHTPQSTVVPLSTEPTPVSHIDNRGLAKTDSTKATMIEPNSKNTDSSKPTKAKVKKDTKDKKDESEMKPHQHSLL